MAPCKTAAQDSAAHEYIPDVRSDEAQRWLQGGFAATEPAQSPGPAEEPTATAGLRPPIEAGGAVASRGLPRFVPDRNTSLQRGVSYFAAFSPTVAPFKRLIALDTVELAADGRTGVLEIGDPRRIPVPVVNRRGVVEARDRFWGEASLDFSRTSVLRLSTVASDVHLLALRADPPVQLTIERDSAHNYYVVLQEQPPSARVHLRYQLDAPRTYFGGEVPEGLPVAALSHRVRPLPPPVLRSARTALTKLGLDRRAELRPALHRLVGYFRSFKESAESPADSGDILLDLIEGQRGICRHRAYGFVILAQALGIPARMVQNEAHSFVEVELPDRGFLRIDLGGAPAGLTAYGVEGRVAYQPWQPDALPQPDGYRASQPQAEQDRSPRVAADSTALVGRWVPLPPTAAGSSGAGGAAGRGATPRASAERRLPLRLNLRRRPKRVIRGALLRLVGRVFTAGGQGVSGQRIEVALGERGRPARLLLGFAQSDPQGVFNVEVRVPADLPPGDYHLLVTTPGDGRHQPAWLD